MLKIITKYLYSIILILFLGACAKENKMEQFRAQTDTSFFDFDTTVAHIKAGELFSMTINRPAKAILLNSWGNYFTSTSEVNGLNTLILADSLTRQSGITKIQFLAEGKMSAQKVLIIEPNPVAEPLESYIGSKSIEADGGKSWAMITAIPQDNYFNMAKTGTKVQFSFAKPSGATFKKNKTTAYGLAYDRINSGFKLGKTKIGVTAEGVSGKEKELQEIPGGPLDFRLETKLVYPVSDSRQNFTLQTSVLRDKYENIVSDGTLVNFYVKDVEGDQRKVSGYSVDGIAKLKLSNPNIAGVMKIQAEVGNSAISNELSLNFKKFVKDLPLKCNNHELIIGPLIGTLNQYVSDGSEVSLTILPENFNRLIPVKDGYAYLYFEDILSGNKEFIVKFGGISTSLKCTINE